MLNVYEQIDANKRKSWLIVGLFTAFMIAFGYFFTYLYGYDYSFMVIAIAISGIGSYISYYNSDRIALSLAGAHPVSAKTHSQYASITDNLSRVARIPTPKIHVIDSPALNAFATGRDPEHGAIAVTQGLLDRLSRTELEGVIAHELAHIKNYDTRLMTIVAILVGSIAMILDWSWRLSWHSSRDSDSRGNAVVMVIGLVFIILAPIIASLIQMSISRRREFLADASAAHLTRQPSGLIGALKKIAYYESIKLETANTATAHLYIDDPVTTETHGSWLARLFSTHPPIADRIKALEGRA